MKYVLCVFTLFLAAQAQAIPIFSLAPSSTSLGFNQAFTVDLFVSGIDAADPLLAFGFDVLPAPGLTYNGTAVAFPFLDDSASFPNTDVAGSTFPPVFGNDILLGTLSFTTGVTAGLLDISILTTAIDFGLSEGLFTSGNTFDIAGSATVDVVRGVTVPVPSTVLLTGLGVLGVVRKRLVRRV